MIWIGILCGFLIFLLNILVGISLYGRWFNESLQWKLWIYLYIQDDVGHQDQIDKQVMEIKESLQNAGLQVSYSTKDDALKFLQKSLPELSGNLEKFGLTNPLPATLYVVFHNQEQYQSLQQVMNDYKSVIMNIQDASQLDNLEQQEARIVQIIRLSNFVQLVCWVLVVVLGLVILSFAIFFLRGLFNTFREDIQVKKLLWATKNQIIKPFLASIAYAVIWGFVLSLILVIISLFVFDYYMIQVFDFALIPQLLGQRSTVISVVWGELIIIMWPLMWISYHFVFNLHKKLK